MKALLRVLVVGVFAGMVILVGQPASAAAPADVPVPCNLMPKDRQPGCVAALAGAGVANPAIGAAVKGTQTAAGAVQTMKNLNPANLPEVWAKSAAESASSFLRGMQRAVLGPPPSLTDPWYLKMFGVMWGIGVVVGAFAITVATAQATGSRAEAVALKKEAGVRGFGYMPAMTILPLVLTMLWQISYELAKWFGDTSSSLATPLVEEWSKQVMALSSFTNFPGQAIGALLFFGLTAVAGFFAKLEVSIAQYGGYIIPLLVPVLGGLAINPRWKHGVRLMGGALTGVLLTPVILFFSFWVMWGVASATRTAQSVDQLGNLMTVVLVGIVVAVLSPVAIALMSSMLLGQARDDFTRLASRSARDGARGVTRSAAKGSRALNLRSGGGGWGRGSGAGGGVRVGGGVGGAAVSRGGQGRSVERRGGPGDQPRPPAPGGSSGPGSSGPGSTGAGSRGPGRRAPGTSSSTSSSTPASASSSPSPSSPSPSGRRSAGSDPKPAPEAAGAPRACLPKISGCARNGGHHAA